MSSYLPPLNISDKFNVSDYNYQYDYTTFGQTEQRYIRKNGSDVVNGTLTFNNYVGLFNYGVRSNANISVYNGATNTILMTKIGDITCSSIQSSVQT